MGGVNFGRAAICILGTPLLQSLETPLTGVAALLWKEDGNQAFVLACCAIAYELNFLSVLANSDEYH